MIWWFVAAVGVALVAVGSFRLGRASMEEEHREGMEVVARQAWEAAEHHHKHHDELGEELEESFDILDHSVGHHGEHHAIEEMLRTELAAAEARLFALTGSPGHEPKVWLPDKE